MLVIWLHHNQMTNWHYHLMSNGVVVIHAHPYNSHTIPDTPFQTHQHNSHEYFFLSLIFNTVPHLVALLVLGFLFHFMIRNLFLFPVAGNIKHSFYRTLLLRGPPKLAQQ